MLRGYSLIAGTCMLLVTATAAAEEYKTPANMTVEDRQQLMVGSNKYQQCVRTELQEVAPKIDDPRAMADAAMAACSNELTALAKEMATSNYDPNYSNYFIDKIKSRVANSTVRQAIFYASQKQRMEEEQAAAAENKGGEK